MVYFICDACGESMKKKQVHNHHCGNVRYSCMDCQTVFDLCSFQAHTKCITENQKYGGVNHVPKVNKGEQKQDAWVGQVRAAIRRVNEPRLKNLLRSVQSHTNIPRKEAKFVKFLQNSLRVRDRTLCVDAWNAIKREAEKEAKGVATATEVTVAEEEGETGRATADMTSVEADDDTNNSTARCSNNMNENGDAREGGVAATPAGEQQQHGTSAAGRKSVLEQRRGAPPAMGQQQQNAARDDDDRHSSRTSLKEGGVNNTEQNGRTKPTTSSCCSSPATASSHRLLRAYFLAVQNAVDRFCADCWPFMRRVVSICAHFYATADGQAAMDLFRSNGEVLTMVSNKLCPNCEDRIESVRMLAEQIEEGGDDDDQEEQQGHEDEHGDQHVSGGDLDQQRDDAQMDEEQQDQEDENGDPSVSGGNADQQQDPEDEHGDPNTSVSGGDADQQQDPEDEHGDPSVSGGDADQQQDPEDEHGDPSVSGGDAEQQRDEARMDEEQQNQEDSGGDAEQQQDTEDEHGDPSVPGGDLPKKHKAEKANGGKTGGDVPKKHKAEKANGGKTGGDVPKKHKAEKANGGKSSRGSTTRRESSYMKNKCDQCDKVFRWQSDLKAHMSLHDPHKFKCTDCDQTFTYAETLRKHNRTRHSDDRPYMCTRCGMAFVDGRRLGTHVRVHCSPKNAVDRPFQCEHCCCRFACASSLNKHMHSHNRTPIMASCSAMGGVAGGRRSGTAADFVDFVLDKKQTGTPTATTAPHFVEQQKGRGIQRRLRYQQHIFFSSSSSSEEEEEKGRPMEEKHNK